MFAHCTNLVPSDHVMKTAGQRNHTPYHLLLTLLSALSSPPGSSCASVPQSPSTCSHSPAGSWLYGARLSHRQWWTPGYASPVRSGSYQIIQVSVLYCRVRGVAGGRFALHRLVWKPHLFHSTGCIASPARGRVWSTCHTVFVSLGCMNKLRATFAGMAG